MRKRNWSGTLRSEIAVGVFSGKMPSMFTGRCPTPDRSFFLFGPRGTGKSTWIRSAIQADVSYDLLDAAESIRLAADPGLLARETAHVPAGGDSHDFSRWRHGRMHR